jgi:hypothetical protein
MLKKLLLSVTLASLASLGATSIVATAKLPPITPEAKMKADEAAAKNAWSDKVAAYKLCLAMDRTVESYRRTSLSAGKQPPPSAATQPCADPGTYTPITPVAQKPLEASEAHSPPGTATSPPSTKATHAEINGKK